MSGKINNTVFTKECMADSLLRLMGEKPFSRITVDEITECAGVHRSTWFRHFSSKNEALTFKLTRLWDAWAADHRLPAGERYSMENAGDFFRFNYAHRDIHRTIYGAGLQPVIYDAFYQIVMPQYAASTEECYQGRFYSHGLFGLLDEWVKRDFQETPEALEALYFDMMGGSGG